MVANLTCGLIKDMHEMTEIPSLTTSRLCLRPFTSDDTAQLHHIYSQEGVLRYFPNPSPPALERVEGFIQAQAKHWAEQGYGNWAVTLSGVLIGWAGLWFIPETAETEVGYLFGRNSWGHGYATEAASTALNFGFTRCALTRIIGLTHPGNAASQRVLEKCGLHYLDRKEYFGMEMARYVISRS